MAIERGKLRGECQRQEEVAELLLEHYGIDERPLTVQDARACILQWEDNNAQLNYLIDEKPEREHKDKKEGIDTFLQENNLQKQKMHKVLKRQRHVEEHPSKKRGETKRRVAGFSRRTRPKLEYMSDPVPLRTQLLVGVIIRGEQRLGD